MPIDAKCLECGCINEVYNSDFVKLKEKGEKQYGTPKRCHNCGAFLDPGYIKKVIQEKGVEKWCWIANNQYIGSGKLTQLVMSAFDKDENLFQVHLRAEKIELLDKAGKTIDIIYSEDKKRF